MNRNGHGGSESIEEERCDVKEEKGGGMMEFDIEGLDNWKNKGTNKNGEGMGCLHMM